MSDDENGFHNLNAIDKLTFVKHNATNFEAFGKFQKELNEKYSKSEGVKEQRNKTKNLLKWKGLVGDRWASASLKTIENTATPEIIKAIKASGKTSFFITGEAGSGKSYLAYAILSAYIGSGWATPSQVERISEDLLLGMASTGFEGRARFNKILDAKNKVFLLDGVGSRRSYNEKEQQLWEQLIDHIYSNSLVVIFTSNSSLEDFSSHLSDSSDSKLQHLINGREFDSASTKTDLKPESKTSKKSDKNKMPAQPVTFGKDGTLL